MYILSQGSHRRSKLHLPQAKRSSSSQRSCESEFTLRHSRWRWSWPYWLMSDTCEFPASFVIKTSISGTIRDAFRTSSRAFQRSSRPRSRSVEWNFKSSALKTKLRISAIKILAKDSRSRSSILCSQTTRSLMGDIAFWSQKPKRGQNWTEVPESACVKFEMTQEKSLSESVRGKVRIDTENIIRLPTNEGIHCFPHRRRTLLLMTLLLTRIICPITIFRWTQPTHQIFIDTNRLNSLQHIWYVDKILDLLELVNMTWIARVSSDVVARIQLSIRSICQKQKSNDPEQSASPRYTPDRQDHAQITAVLYCLEESWRQRVLSYSCWHYNVDNILRHIIRVHIQRRLNTRDWGRTDYSRRHYWFPRLDPRNPHLFWPHQSRASFRNLSVSTDNSRNSECPHWDETPNIRASFRKLRRQYCVKTKPWVSKRWDTK